MFDEIDTPFILTIKDINDKKYYINCYGLEHTIEYIKFVLDVAYGFDSNSVLLFLKDRELMDYKTFYQSGICSGTSDIRLYIKFKSGLMI